MAQKWSSSKSDTGRVISSSILALGLVFPKTALFREETPGKQVKKKKRVWAEVWSFPLRDKAKQQSPEGFQAQRNIPTDR